MTYRYLSKFSTLFYGISYYFSEILMGVAIEKGDLQILLLKAEEKFMENVRGSDQF